MERLKIAEPVWSSETGKENTLDAQIQTEETKRKGKHKGKHNDQNEIQSKLPINETPRNSDRSAGAKKGC